jgi:cell division septal protein FtsQ
MKKNLKNKLNDFFLSNRILRALRIFIHQKLKPLFLKIIIASLALITLIVITLQMVKPDYLSGLYQKYSFYFQHYLNLDYEEFGKINVVGNNRTSSEEIIKIVKEVKDSANINNVKGEYEPLIQKMSFKIKKQLPWVNQVSITRNIPNIINITVTEYEPFAIWNHDNKKYAIDKDGNKVLIEDKTEFSNLIIVSGDEANIHVNSLFNIFAIDPYLSSQVYSATWSGGRRWDIRLNTGLLIKLPESEIGDAWSGLIKIYNMHGSLLGLNVIDLRVSGKVYLEYGDSVIKEIKDL